MHACPVGNDLPRFVNCGFWLIIAGAIVVGFAIGYWFFMFARHCDRLMEKSLRAKHEKWATS